MISGKTTLIAHLGYWTGHATEVMRRSVISL